MDIKQVTIKELEQVSKLFADYRVFYEQPYDIEIAQSFIKDRLTEKDSVIFGVVDNGEYIGFTQIYPSFTSIGAKKIWILNDLFVSINNRQRGVAKLLINHVLEYSKITNRKKVILSTAYDNKKAQSLYEKLGFVQATHYNYEKLT